MMTSAHMASSRATECATPRPIRRSFTFSGGRVLSIGVVSLSRPDDRYATT